MKRLSLRCGDREFHLGTRTFVMGILNVTPDSFSDGGYFLNAKSAIEHAQKLIRDGADIIDIGAESTRPGAQSISVLEEQERIIPIVRELGCLGIRNISIDTRNASTAQRCLDEGASWINDVSGLTYDVNMMKVYQQADAVVVMHARGTPDTMQQGHIAYDDVVTEVRDWLSYQIRNLDPNKTIVDPGIGFGKRLSHNLELIRHLDAFQNMGAAVLCGLSRKSFMRDLLGIENPLERDLPTLAATMWSVSRGVDIVRVHDVKTTASALKIVDALQYGESHA